MTPKISLIIGIAGAALVLGVPAAFGKVEPGVSKYPDAVERAVFAREQVQRIDAGLGNMPDAFERAVLAKERGSVIWTYVDAHGRSALAGDRQSLSAASRYPDAFQRALVTESTRRVLADSHDRIAPTSTPVVAAVDSGRDVEWPQVGIGFGIGILLALGLGMALRFTRIRQLAH
jgi:hypothetical protein